MGFDWLNHEGVKNVLSLIYSILDILKIVVPIILIIMTTMDIIKKVINPNEKEGQQKILRRVIAAIIIFFIPTMINFVFNLAGIKISKDEINTLKQNNSQTISKNNNLNNKTSLSNLKITNCPSSLNIYHNGDSYTINTNIPSNYDESIIWSVKAGNKNVQTSVSNNKKSLDIKFSNITMSDRVVIDVTSAGKSSTCTIYVDKEKLESLSFTNCPNTRNRYYIGDTIELNTDIKESFNGNITWTTDEKDSVKINTSGGNRSATISILDQPKKKYVFIKVSAESKVSNCLINIAAVHELMITNCPSKDNVYHVGDTIILNSNIPNFYKDDILWQSTTAPDSFIITPINNGRSAQIKIVTVPSNNSGAIGLGADLKGTSCLLYIK